MVFNKSGVFHKNRLISDTARSIGKNMENVENLSFPQFSDTKKRACPPSSKKRKTFIHIKKPLFAKNKSAFSKKTKVRLRAEYFFAAGTEYHQKDFFKKVVIK